MKQNENEQTEISAPYELPEWWNKKHDFSFGELASAVQKLHESSYSSAVKAVNRIAAVRNYVIGFYIVEYEQNGKDRAEYGSKLIKTLAEKIGRKGLERNSFEKLPSLLYALSADKRFFDRKKSDSVGLFYSRKFTYRKIVVFSHCGNYDRRRQTGAFFL